MRRLRQLGALFALLVLASPASPLWLCLCTGDLLAAQEECSCCCMMDMGGPEDGCGHCPDEGERGCDKMVKMGGEPRAAAEAFKLGGPDLLAAVPMPNPEWISPVEPPALASPSAAFLIEAPPPWRCDSPQSRLCVFLI